MSDYTTKGRAPAFQFYPGDYLKDPAVRAVSLAARGLWMDMLCIMHESPQRGLLQLQSGSVIPSEQLARMVGSTAREVGKLLTELDSAGVYSRTDEGVIYSRRMVRDNRKLELCRQAGYRGGNPALKTTDNPTLKGAAKGDANPEITPSSSSSSSSSDNPLPPNQPAGPSHRPDAAKFGTWEMDESYCPFVELYRGSGKPVINEDFADAWWQWKLLDFEQKRMRIDRLKSNLDNQLYSDPTYIPMPRKFIEREWKRELRPQPKARTVEPEPELVNIDPAEAARRSVIEYQQFIRDRDRDRKQQAAS